MLPRALLLPLVLAAAPTAAAAPFKTPTLGTPLTWHRQVAAAQLVASAEQKLVLALHLSGDFRDAAKTCPAAQRLRATLNDPQLRPLLRHFVGAHQTAGTLVIVKRGARTLRQQGGGVALFVLTPTGRVVHAIAGSRSPADLTRELTWAVKHAGDADQLARAHRAAARALSPIRVLSPAAPRPLGARLTDLGHSAPALTPVLQRALIHARLANPAESDLATTSKFVWTQLLGQTCSDVPVRELQMRWRCRIPIRRFPCARAVPADARALVKELEALRARLRIQKARRRVKAR